MGDRRNNPLRVDFDREIKLEFHGSTVTSDAGLLAYRELDDALGLTRTAASGLHETRTGLNTQHCLLALLRQSIYSRLAGYEDVNDAERLCLDPALRTVVGGRTKDNTAASAGEMARFETETLSTKKNLKHLMDLPGRWIDRAHHHRQLAKLILDMDSSVSETYGQQGGAAYHGHFGCTCYHPLIPVQPVRRPGAGPAAAGPPGQRQVLAAPVVAPDRAVARPRHPPQLFRGDPAWALPKPLRLLKQEG
jgi:hypothetical protein